MKEWYEKENEYEERWRAGRISADIWKYIPEKYWSGIYNAFADSDGYWIWLDENHVAYDGAMDCGTIHEYTIADLKESVKTIRAGKR